VRRYKNSTIEPDEFNIIWNEATTLWQGLKLPLVEFNQKRIDDLSQFHVVTDGSPVGSPLISTTIHNIFQVPIAYDSVNDGIITSVINGVDYPMYRHGLNAMFRVPGSTDFFRVRIMRSDQRAINQENPYRQAKTTRPYFEFINNQIRLEGRDSAFLRLEYVRYPKIATYDGVDENMSLDPETTPAQNEEIVQLAVSLYLENKGDPRYKTQFQQMMFRSQGS
jgi:hypothetical protein